MECGGYIVLERDCCIALERGCCISLELYCCIVLERTCCIVLERACCIALELYCCIVLERTCCIVLERDCCIALEHNCFCNKNEARHSRAAYEQVSVVMWVKRRLDHPAHPLCLMSSLSVCMKSHWTLALQRAPSQDSDQTVWMCRLIQVFAGPTYHFSSYQFDILQFMNHVNRVLEPDCAKSTCFIPYCNSKLFTCTL